MMQKPVTSFGLLMDMVHTRYRQPTRFGRLMVVRVMMLNESTSVILKSRACTLWLQFQHHFPHHSLLQVPWILILRQQHQLQNPRKTLAITQLIHLLMLLQSILRRHPPLHLLRSRQYLTIARLLISNHAST